MKENTKTTILVIAVIICAIAMTFISYKIINNDEQKEPVSSSTNVEKDIESKNEETNKTENEVLNKKEEKAEEAKENEEKNKDQNKEEENDEINNVEEPKTPQVEGATNQEKAINIVKNKWGQSNDVYFAAMGIDTEGKYIISVNDSATSAVRAWCYVDVDKAEIVVK